MRDKLTKKRLKVDYTLIIMVHNLEHDFLVYQADHPSNRSLRRQQYSFLLKNKVDIEGTYLSCKEHGITSRDEFLKEQYRIVKTKWLDD